MSFLNSALRGAFGAVLDPISDMSPWVGLVPLSILTAVLMLLVFKYTSNQDRLALAKDRMFAGIFELRLFNDDLVLMNRAIGTIFKHSLHYMAIAFYPALLIILPILVLMLGQLEFRYAHGDLATGEPVLLEVELHPPAGQESFAATAAKPRAELELPGGVRAETAPVWVPSQSQLAWRLVVDEPGLHVLTVSVDGATATKTLAATDEWVQVAPVRPEGSFLDQLLYPAEPPVDDPTIRRIAVSYPSREVDFFGWHTYWMWPFFILSILFGFALAKPMKVTV